MRRAILFVLLLAFGSAAHAGWARLMYSYEDEYGTVCVYQYRGQTVSVRNGSWTCNNLYWIDD